MGYSLSLCEKHKQKNQRKTQIIQQKAGSQSGYLLKFLVVVDKTCISAVTVNFDKRVQKDFIFDRYSVFYSAVVKAVFSFLHIIAVKHIEVDTAE